MQKTLLITGSTDGIGLETAKLIASQGHDVLLHGRNPTKLSAAQDLVSRSSSGGKVEAYAADLSRLDEVDSLAREVAEKHERLDVLINNAGVFGSSNPATDDGLDVRFVVNTIAPYQLTQRLLPRLGSTGRVVNLSSAAQSPVDVSAMTGKPRLDERAAYAQSKLALTMWSRSLAQALGDEGPAIIAVNPGSLLATKMVKQAFGVPGSDIRIGAEILRRAALDEEFASASGQYFDNDSGRFAAPHPDALDERKAEEVVRAIEGFLADRSTH